MTSISDLSKGNFVDYQGEIARIEELAHRTPGNLRAFYQVKMRSLRTGKIIENRFRPSDNIRRLDVETKEHQYLYEDDDHLVCMDTNTYEQVHLEKKLLGTSVQYLKEGTMISIIFEHGKQPITADPPLHVTLSVTYTEPGLSGDTATRTLKPATIETGVEIKVPLFINTGDKIKIDAKSGTYVERVK